MPFQTPPPPTQNQYVGILDPRLKNKLQQSDAVFTDQKQGDLNKALDAFKVAQGKNITPPQHDQGQITPYTEPSFLQNSAFTGKSFLTGVGESLSDTGEGIKHFGQDIEKGLMHLGENVRGASPAERAQDAAAMQSEQWGNEPLNPAIAKALPGGLANPFDMNKDFIQSGDEGHPVATMAKDLGNLVATIVGSAETGGSSFVLQGVGSGAKEVEKMKANGIQFKNGSDEMYIYGKGLINLFLHKSIAGTVLEGKPGLTNDVVSSLSADATKELADAAGSATVQDMAQAYYTKAAKFTEGLQQWGLGVVKKFPIVGAEMAAANVANVGLKAGVNAINGRDTFQQGASAADVPGAISSAFYGGDPHDAHGDLGKVALGLLNSPAAGFSLLHGLSTAGALIPGTPYRNVVVESLQHDSSTGNVEKIKAQLADIGAQKGWTPDQIHNTQQTVDALADVAGKIPKDIAPEKFGKALDIILKRRTLEGVLKSVNDKSPTLDPAFTDKVEPFKDLVNARIEKENDNLTELVKDKKFTYSFKEGKYYKTMTGAEPEEITKDRYELEKLKTEQPQEAAPVEDVPKEAEQPKSAPAAEVPTNEAPKPAAPVAGLDELDNELDSLKQPEAPAPAKPETGIDPNGYQAAAKAEGYKRIDQHPVGSTIDWHGKPMIFVKETSSLAHLKDPESGNTITTNSGNYVKLYDQPNKEETDNAIQERSAKTSDVGAASGDSTAVGGRVPAPGQAANARTGEEVQSNGQEAQPAGRQPAGEHGLSEAEIKADNEAHAKAVDEKVRPIADQMVKIENQFNNEGYDLSDDYDSEVLVMDKKTGEQVGPDELPDHLQELAAQYETVLQKLSEHTHEMGKHLQEARQRFNGEDVTHEDVTNQRLPEGEKPYYIAHGGEDKPNYEEVQGKPVPNQVGLDLFSHQTETGYAVSDGSTGLQITKGDTEEEALQKLHDITAYSGFNGIEKAINEKYEKGIQSPRGRVSKPKRTEAVITQATAALGAAKAITGGGNETRAQKAEAIKSIDKAIDEIDKHLEENGRDAETGEPKEPTPEPEPTERDQRKADREAKKAKVKEKLDAAIKDFTDFGRKHANALINPEYLQKGLKMMKLYAEAGILKFEDIAEDLADTIGEELRGMFDALKASYLAYAAEATDDEVDQMDNIRSVRKVKIEDILTPQENEHNTDNGRPEVDENPPAVPPGEQPGTPATNVPEKHAESAPGRGIEQGSTPGSEVTGKRQTAVLGTGGVSSSGGGTSAGLGPDGQGEPAGDTGQGVPKNPAKRKLAPADQNHVIRPDDKIGQGTALEKFNGNMDAIFLLNKLEKEDRNPSPAEKQQLAKFVGWGGLSEFLKGSSSPAHETAVNAVMTGRSAQVQNGYSYWDKKTVDFSADGPVDMAKYSSFNELAGYVKDKLVNSGVAISIDDVRKTLVKNLLSRDEMQGAINSTINAHYTEKQVITKMWELARQLGFKGGNVLEPSAGIGHFFGLMPKDIAEKSTLTGYELDSLTGRMLKKLYPEARITVGGFEKAKVKPNSQDMIITNVPFAQTAPYDANFPELSKFNMHNYFIAKSMRLLKPGGVAIIITSKSTMDGDVKFRDWANSPEGGNSYLVGAVRLPNNAFSENAGTQVTTDMLVFQKRSDSTVDLATENAFRYTQPLGDVDKKGEPIVHADSEGKPVDININEYYHTHPQNMLGKMMTAHEAGAGGLYGSGDATLHAAPGYNVLTNLSKAVKAMPSDIMVSHSHVPQDKPQEHNIEAMDKKEGSMFEKNGKIYVVSGDQGVPQTLTATQAKAAKAYIDVKGALMDLLNQEMAVTPTEDIEALRTELNKKYDAFFAKHGTLSNNRALNFISDGDIDFPLTESLETVKYKMEEDKSGRSRRISIISKSPIFDKRVNFPRTEPTKAENIQDAINVSLNYHNGLDLNYIAQLTGQSIETAKNTLLSEGLAFENPTSGVLETPEQYLSGYVRDKLVEAQAAAKLDPKMERNVVALEKVIPKDIPSSLIQYSLGSSWIPASVYEGFIKELIGVETAVRYKERTGKWEVRTGSGLYDSRNITTYAAGGRSAIDLLEDSLNNRQTTIHASKADGGGVLMKETEAARAKQEELQEAFVSHMRSNTQAQELTEPIYNNTFNGHVEREWTVPDIEYYPGQSKEIKMYKHQKKSVTRGLNESTMGAQEVGSGKTFIQHVLVMEAKRLGLARKTLVGVLNSTLGQYVTSFRKMYPTAKLLVPTKAEMEPKGRAKLFAKIATQDWDAIILPHSQVTMIPDDPERQKAYIREQVDEMMAALEEAQGYNEKKEINKALKDLELEIMKIDDPDIIGYDKSGNIKRKVKDVAKKALGVEKGISKALDRHTDKTALNFEQMGIDNLIIDEAHEFKKLGFQTAFGQIKGIDPGKSQRSQSLYLKTRWIQEKTGGKNVNFFTGTPISNTMAEVWTWMRYLRPDMLKRMGIESFDQFVNTFGVIAADVEFTSTGTFKNVNRFRSFQNAPELLNAFRAMSYVLLKEDVQEFIDADSVPKLKNGKPTRRVIPITPPVEKQIKQIMRRLEWYNRLSGQEKKKNKHVPMVSYGMATKSAIDPRLIDPAAEDHPLSKLNYMIKDAIAKYHETTPVKGTQMIFSDKFNSVNGDNMYMDEDGQFLNPAYGKKAFNLFDDIRKKLIAGGVPAHEIAIVSDPKYDNQLRKEALFEDMKEGKIRFALGSTAKMGVGVNAQDRMVGQHHIDAPVRPMDDEQRDGRMIRPGNLNKIVEKFIYGMEGTADAQTYQMLTNKSKFIKQLMKSGTVERVIDDAAGEVVLDYDEMMASLSGSQYAMKKISVDAQIKKEKTKKDIFHGKIIQAGQDLRHAERSLVREKATLKDQLAQAHNVSELFPDGNILSLKATGQEEATDKFSEAADKYLERLRAKFEQSPTKYSKGAFQLNGVEVELSMSSTPSGEPMLYYSIPELGIIDRMSDSDSGFYVPSGKGVGLLASIRSKISDVQIKPANTQAHIKQLDDNITRLKVDVEKQFDDKHLKELEKESEDLKEKMIQEGIAKEAKNKAANREEDDTDPDDEGGDDEPPVGPQPTGGVTGGVFDHTNIAGALDWLDKQKAKTGNQMMGMLIPIPPAIWNGAIDVMKGILKATNSTQKAIRVASKYIQDRGGSVAQAKDFEQSMNEKMTNTKAGQLAILPDSEEAHTPEEMLRGAQLIQSRVKLANNLTPDEQALSNIELTLLNKKELHRYIEIGAVLAVDPQGVLTADVNDFFARVENRMRPKMGTSVPPPVPPVPPTGDGGAPDDEEPISPRGRIPKANKLPMDPLAEEAEPEDNLPEGTRQNYSIWGNLKDIHVRNLEQLKAYGNDISSMDALREAIKLATSRSQSSVDIKLANDRITRLVGEAGYKALREALIESRLRGTRQRWNDFARQIKVTSDNEIDDLFEAGKRSPMYSILSDLQGYDGDESPATTILTHLDNGEYDDAREYMSDMFSHAGDNVAYYDKLSNGKTFDEMTHKVDGEVQFRDPKMQEALGQYKQHIEKPFMISHESNDGIFSDALGPLETYYPLTATGTSAHKVYMPSRSKYNAPDNINNHFTTGSADQYSSAISDLSRKLGASIKTNNKATFINALQEANLIHKVSADAPNTAVIEVQGVPYTARKVPISDARTIIQNGTAVTVPVRYLMIPDWLYKEIAPIIEGEDDLKGDDHYSIMGHVLNASVNLMLGGPAEAISHTHRLLSAITNSMPYMQEWAYKNGVLGHAGGLILNNLFVKKFTGMGKVLFTNAGSDEFAADVQEMAKLGLIPEKTWTHTYSAEFARSMGVDPVQFPIPYKDIASGEWKKVFKKGKLFDFSPMLYGRNGFDLKARVVMYRLVKAMNPEATPEQHVKMQGDMGQYTQSLQARVEKFIKKHGFGPFATFARTYYRAGFKAVTGTTPLPIDAPNFKRLFSGGQEAGDAAKFMYYKLAQLISSGVLGYIGYWALAHHGVTGKWPWDDKHSKIGKIPITEGMKRNKLIKKYFFNKRTGAYDDLDMSFFNIPMSRGLRATGIDRAYQVHQLGGTTGQSVEASQVEAANTMAGMYSSSALISIPFTTMTGDAPYMTTLRGFTGKAQPGFLKKVNTAPAGLQLPMNFAAGMMGINPLLESLNPASGAIIDEYNAEDYQSGKLMKSIINIAMPGLISPHGSDDKQSDNLHKQAKAIATTLEKEHHKAKK